MTFELTVGASLQLCSLGGGRGGGANSRDS